MTNAVIFCDYSNEYLSVRPAGAYVIANVFRECGYSAVVLNHILKLDNEKVKNLIYKFVDKSTKYICLSSTLFNYASSFDYAFAWIFDMCKDIAKDAIFIVGGSSIIHGLRPMLPFNYGVIGQAESTLLSIMRHIEYGDELIVSEEVNGVKYISDKIYTYDNYNSSEHSKFTKHDGIRPNETLPLEFGRGCVFKCSYCTYDLLGKTFNDMTKTEESLYNVLMHNYECFGTTRYMFTDDTINDSLEKALLLERVVNRLPFKFEFGGYMRLELFHKHPEMMEIYKNCGVRGTKFGIETFNRKAGLTVGKGFGEKAKDVLGELYKSWGDDVAISVNFLIGLPYDTLEDLERQTQWLEASNIIGYTNYNPLSIWKKEKNGFNTKPELLNYYTDMSPNNGSVFSNWKSPIMTSQECKQLATAMDTRVNAKRKTLIKRVDGFGIPILMEKLSLEQLQSTIDPLIVRQVINGYFKQIQMQYYDDMMNIVDPIVSTNINIPKPISYKNMLIDKIILHEK
jgi:radical SAM superfamily enzyme YgiQ (UPF0313 family)